ncbi:unnamed protein product [Brugia timori]|uniref:ZP domain-containing protein n=1 Tax=Brugia timori TaxID=42155 RepID=A0A0R3QD36_9BILA|nr:unnamed protein product [Brugia timori]
MLSSLKFNKFVVNSDCDQSTFGNVFPTSFKFLGRYIPTVTCQCT